MNAKMNRFLKSVRLTVEKMDAAKSMEDKAFQRQLNSLIRQAQAMDKMPEEKRAKSKVTAIKPKKRRTQKKAA